MGSAETQMKGGSLSGITVKWCKNDGKQSMTFGLSIFIPSVWSTCVMSGSAAVAL